MKISFALAVVTTTTAGTGTTTPSFFSNAFTIQHTPVMPVRATATIPDKFQSSASSSSSSSLYSNSYASSYAAATAGTTNNNYSYGTTPTTATATGSNRKSIVAGNWKLNPKNKQEAIELLQGLKAGSSSDNNENVEVVIFPPLPFLNDALSILQGTGIKVGAQTASSFEEGAYTGEISPSILSSVGCSYVLLGHSERRTIFDESDTSINERLKLSLKESDLKVILCIGETLEEYEAGLLNSVVDTQLRKGLAGIDAQDLLNDRVIIAYEPVWAIGTGLVATPDQAQTAHAAIRTTINSMYSDTAPTVASSMRIQYGGSVKPDSIKELMAMPDVDGALVGGACLDALSFTQIVQGSSSTTTTTTTTTLPVPSVTSSVPRPYNYIPPPPITAAAVTPTPPTLVSQINFSHAPISYFSIDKLQSKGPRKNADVGSPHDSTRPQTSIGNLSSGSWWCAAGGWPSPNLRATTEIFYVLEGHACVTDMDGTKNFFGPGDVVVLPKGWSGRWDVLNDIHKIWVVVDHPDVANNVRNGKAIIKPYSSFAPQYLSSNGVRVDATHGSPVTASDTYLDNGYMSTGTWTCTAGSFPVSERATTEAFHLLEGIAFLTNSDGSARRCVAGDTVVLPKGWTGQWDVIEPIKKVWVSSYF